MTFGRSGGPAATVRIPRGAKWVVPVVVGLFVLIGLGGAAVGLATDVLWYQSVGFSSVLWTRLGSQAALFAVFGLSVAAVIGANIVVAYRLRPPFRPRSTEQAALEQYRGFVDPYRWWLLAAVLLLIVIAEGSWAATSWRLWLQWRNAVSFGVTDAQFHKDVSFFAFTYPILRVALTAAFVAVGLSAVAAAVVHYLYGALRVSTPGEKTSAAARAHLSVLLGVFLLLKAGAYWVDRWGLAFSPRGVVTGPSYTDVNAVLPSKTILVFVAVICAGLFFANVYLRNWLLPVVATGVMVLSAIVIGGVYPAVVQHFQVRPSEADKEAPYIQRNITATRQAYGLDGVTVTEYAAQPTGSPDTQRAEATQDAQIRLLDPSRLDATFRQLQQQRAFYGFADTLDIDRYPIDGKLTDTVVAAREIDLGGLSSGQDNWINRHLVYTHGFGFVAAPAATVDSDGRPIFIEKDIPPTGSLGEFQPRIYFGEKSPTYSVVGAPAGAKPRELDRPGDTGTGQVNTTYQGNGGVPIGSKLRQALFALKFGEKNLLLSSALNSDSRILYVRNPRTRVKAVAPWLTLDGDPYPVVVDGRILWVLDGYTTTDGYPYSQRSELGQATADTLTQTSAVTRQPNREINYIRNSVKATVDAYDGTVRLYAWDDSDPVLKTWMRAFSGTVLPKSAIPPELAAHFRYPEDLFKVQRALLARYHVTDPQAFYNGTDFWKVPADPTGDTPGDQPPYYLSLRLPGDDKPVFSLTSTFVASNRPNLTGFLAVSSQPGQDYGKLRLLELPRNVTVNGPGQVQNAFEADPTASQSLALLRSGGSQVQLGNLLTLPVSGGFLYVEPVYVRAQSGESFPTVQKILASFGERIAYANTLGEALDGVFGAAAQEQPPSGQPTGPTQPTQVNTALRQALADAQQALKDGQAALAKGDFAAYGEAQKRLADAIRRADEASRQGQPAQQ